MARARLGDVRRAKGAGPSSSEAAVSAVSYALNHLAAARVNLEMLERRMSLNAHARSLLGTALAALTVLAGEIRLTEPVHLVSRSGRSLPREAPRGITKAGNTTAAGLHRAARGGEPSQV